MATNLLKCTCPGTDDERRAEWVVTVYKANHSSFNGRRRTASAYSQVLCKKCKGYWRTKAAYVETLTCTDGQRWYAV